MYPHIIDTPNIADRPWQNPHVYGIVYHYNLDTPEKALRYFESTPLNDPQSQNFYLGIQTSDRDPATYPFSAYLNDLDNTIGYRYIVDERSSRFPLWVIHKELKLTSTESWSVIGVYTILNGIIWQAPTIHDLVQTRLLDTISLLQSSLSNLTSHLPRSSNRIQQHWTSLPAEIPGDGSGDGKVEEVENEEKYVGESILPNDPSTTQTIAQPQPQNTSATTETATTTTTIATATHDEKPKREKRKRNILPDTPNFALHTALALGEEMKLNLMMNRNNSIDIGGFGVSVDGKGDGGWSKTKEEEEADELMFGGGKRRGGLVATR